MRDYHRENGFWPSLREIATMTKTVPSNVLYHLHYMEAEGLTIYHPGRARSWVLAE